MRKTLTAAILSLVAALMLAVPAVAQVVSGPTEAPDLAAVSGFTQTTVNGTTYTLVEYTFDQEAYLNGGDRSSFHLVPLDAGDAVDGSGIESETDVEGDNIIRVLYKGVLVPTDYARGYVDTGTVNSFCCNVGSENPANINHSEPVSNGGLTENPDLVSVQRDGADSFLFEFDEPLTDDDVVQNTSGLRVYFPETTQNSTIPDVGAQSVEAVNDTTLRAFFSDDLPEGYSLDDVVGAFVNDGTVQAAVGSRGGDDGKNAFDELFVDGYSYTLDAEVCSSLVATIVDSGKIKGTSGDDVIVGSSGADTIDGKGGNDVICGRGGDDRIKGDDGMDVLFGEDGDDKLKGQDGNDLLFGGDGNDLLKGQEDNDEIAAGEGADDLRGQDGSDTFDGGFDNDTDTSDYDANEDVSQTNIP